MRQRGRPHVGEAGLDAAARIRVHGEVLANPKWLGTALDRLAVGNLRRLQEDPDSVFALEPLAADLDVKLSAAGDQDLVGFLVAIDAKWEGDRAAVYVRSGSTPGNRDAVEWAREAEERGAGEILLTSIDRDGTKIGFDCPLTAAVSAAVSIPVIASGGAGSLDDFVDVFTAGRADAALAASIFHYAETSVNALKQHLRSCGISVRL